MAYSEHAFDCARCPGKAGDGGCPAFWSTVHENPQTGETKVINACGFEQLPLYLIEVIKASNRPAAAVESMRNEMVKGLGAIAHGVQALPKPGGDGG